MTITAEDRAEYNGWYHRCITTNDGGAEKLRFKIHVLPVEFGDGRKAADFEADLRKTGTGEDLAGWLAKGYQRVLGDIKGIDAKVIESAMAADDNAEWPATCRWFPPRAQDRDVKNAARKGRKRGRRLVWLATTISSTRVPMATPTATPSLTVLGSRKGPSPMPMTMTMSNVEMRTKNVQELQIYST